MSLPALSTWDHTRTALRQAMQVLRSTRLLGVDPMPNDLHYSTRPTRSGASTGPLRFGGALHLDYTSGAIVYESDGQAVFSVALDGHHQTSLFEAVFAQFEQAGHELQPERGKITESAPFDLDLDQARAYADVQYRMYRVLATVKAHMYGPQTPLVLWPHGFDLSTIWFVDDMDEHSDPHLNVGFSPGTPDIDQPYFYFYAWPVPDGLSNKLHPALTWHTAWSTPGAVLPYERFAREPDPEAVAADILIQSYHLASSLLKAGVASG